THTLPIKSLMPSNLARKGTASYWTGPGDYTLVATYQTAVSPVPEGAKDNGNGFGPVTVVSAPLKLQVVDKNPEGKTDPPGVPLEVRLVAKKGTYTLDLGGKTPEQFRKLLHDGPRPASPEVDLVLEFRNTGDKEIKFLVGGANPDIPLLLQLHGHGAVNVSLPALMSDTPIVPPESVSLAPGKSYALPIKSLMTKNLGRDGSASYWTEPGEYKLIATYQTAVSPAPKDAKASYWNKGT